MQDRALAARANLGDDEAAVVLRDRMLSLGEDYPCHWSLYSIPSSQWNTRGYGSVAVGKPLWFAACGGVVGLRAAV
jgi:hypothetical protein